MSNPSINRWGLNLFWYRFWYNDKINTLLYHQDSLFIKLLPLYFNYGVVTSRNILIKKYWYNNFLRFDKHFYENNETKCFRFVEYKNRIINEYRTYKLRIKFKNLYTSKIWIMRYQNWLIIVLSYYQPLTKNKNKNFLTKKLIDSFTYQNKINNKNTFLRYKFLIFFYFNSIISDNFYYKF